VSGVEREAGAGAVDPRADELAHLISWHLAAGNSATVSFLRGYSALTQTNADLLAALQGVVRVADRNTDEFNAARAAIARATGERK
jgi:hypothetical protein